MALRAAGARTGNCAGEPAARVTALGTVLARELLLAHPYFPALDFSSRAWAGACHCVHVCGAVLLGFGCGLSSAGVC